MYRYDGSYAVEVTRTRLRPRAAPTSRRLSALHRELGHQAFATAEDRREGKGAAPLPKPQSDIVSAWITILIDLVPTLGMADVVNRDVIMLGPEERHGREALAPVQHV